MKASSKPGRVVMVDRLDGAAGAFSKINAPQAINPLFATEREIHRAI
jgi:hypothetical protein